MEDYRLSCPISLSLDCRLNEVCCTTEGFNDKNESIRPNSYNFLRQVSFSASGQQILAVSDFQDVSIHSLEGDYSSLHYYQTSERESDTQPSLSLVKSSSFHLPEAFSDLIWHPDTTSCRMAASVRDQPIHMYSVTGQVLQSYSSLNMEDIEHHQSLLFHPYGHLLYAGADKKINIFNVEQGGKPIQTISTVNTKMQDYGIIFGQKGLVSCLAHRPDPSCASSMYAAGCLDGSVGIYDDSMSESAMCITGLKYAVNCCRWSRCGNYLFISGRKHNSIDCYDVRSRLSVVGAMPRKHASMQRFSFDLDPWTRLLTAGDEDSQLLTYDTLSFSLVHRAQCREAVNSVSFHPYASLLAAGMGSRHFIDNYSSSDSDSDGGEGCIESRSDDGGGAGRSGISLWSLPSRRLMFPVEEPQTDAAPSDASHTVIEE